MRNNSLFVCHESSGARWRASSCTGFLTRLRGLSGRRALQPDFALHLPACRAVHSIGMCEPIDVVFCDRRGQVLRVVPALAPWRAAWSLRAWQVFEFRAGEAARAGMRPGDRLAIDGADTR